MTNQFVSRVLILTEDLHCSSAAALDWREGDSSIEKAVRCCGCGSTISVAESRAATTPGGSAVFSCSPECECDYEQS